ncbi:MAG: RdgB/HAM1 family non-canonical purine NTP pyrophosphatase [Rhodothermales bacterium]|nr:RdgB/HAM1 family non-canonical purine NTP pyrophosphatase [Rhodothermales bacterium]
MKLVLATRNAGKVAEMRALLGGLVVEVLGVDAFPGIGEVEEDAPTLAGNASKKAREVFAFTGLPSLADDTGLEVRALGGRPGVHSARYAGEDANPVANRRRLLAELQGAGDRSARFTTVLAYHDGEQVYLFEGLCEGRIEVAERGDGGFGYDPLFLPDGESQTFAELPAARKNTISHRGRAMMLFRTFLIERLTATGT